jgi:hypothetical protein
MEAGAVSELRGNVNDEQLYGAIGLAGIGAARVLRKRNTPGYLLAGVFIVVAFDFLGDLVLKRTSGLDRDDLLPMTLTGGILLATIVCLARSRLRPESD